jgi:hypothetical protein
MESAVPIRAITAGPSAHWFGYYDKQQFDPTGRYVLGMQTAFEGRDATPEDAVTLGMVDTEDGDRWIPFGQSRAWSWQQGCMLQWLPGADATVIYNDRRGGEFVSVIHEVFTNHTLVLPRPIYAVAPNGKNAVTLNFARLERTRPGYGYATPPADAPLAAAPGDDGVFVMNLETGESKLLHSLANVASFAPQDTMNGGTHWFNHLLVNPLGDRFIFLHRWRTADSPSGPWSTRMLTSGLGGENLRLVADHGMVSHFIWKNPRQILAWSQEPETGAAFHLYQDQTEKAAVVGESVLTQDGHCTYSPDGEWILTDTYPDRERMQTLMLYRPADGKLITLGKFFMPRAEKAPFRCDLHPRWSRDGRTVCIDSMHTGQRQMYLLDVSAIVTAGESQ